MVPQRLAMRQTRGKPPTIIASPAARVTPKVLRCSLPKGPGVLEHSAYIIGGKGRLHSVITEDPFIGSIEKPR